VTLALGAGERERLNATFAQLCQIPSVTGDERGVADWITAELRSFGLSVVEDDAGGSTGSNAGNLLVTIPGRSDRWVMLCAHMDTVPLTAPVEPVLRGDGWENAGEGILGADNKAAVAALVEVARMLAGGPGGAGGPGEAGASGAEVGVELLFTVSEETGLHGAKAFDTGRLRSSFGYVFDHATSLGEVIVASPTYMRITGSVHGRAAHAGLHPEQGVNAIVAAAAGVVAMPQGRLDPETTANVGRIFGGTATNVVAEHCTVEAEVRGISQERVDAVVTEVIDAFQDAADSHSCDLDIGIEKMFTGYRVRSGEPTLVLADRALRRVGYEPREVVSGGGSDANAFRVNGFPVLNLANGTERAHEPGERVSVQALEDGLALVCALLDEAGWLHPADSAA
jgi:tripeptide aminopeptidase